MNERIKELAEQAGLIADGEHWFSAIQETDVRSIDLERFAELVRQDAYGLPTIEDASQNWAKVDGAVAWHLIERHADNWADVGKMMDEFVAAHVRMEREACAKVCLTMASKTEDIRRAALEVCAENILARGGR